MTRVIPATSQSYSPLGLVSWSGRRSHRMKWLSIKPVWSLYYTVLVAERTSRLKCTYPLCTSATASASASLMTCWAYTLNDACAACNNAVTAILQSALKFQINHPSHLHL